MKEIMTKLEKEDKQEKDTQKDSKILTKLLTMKIYLEICQSKRIKIPQRLKLICQSRWTQNFENVTLWKIGTKTFFVGANSLFSFF